MDTDCNSILSTMSRIFKMIDWGNIERNDWPSDFFQPNHTCLRHSQPSRASCAIITLWWSLPPPHNLPSRRRMQYTMEHMLGTVFANLTLPCFEIRHAFTSPSQLPVNTVRPNVAKSQIEFLCACWIIWIASPAKENKPISPSLYPHHTRFEHTHAHKGCSLLIPGVAFTVRINSLPSLFHISIGPSSRKTQQQ